MAMKGRTTMVETACGHLYITVNRDKEGKIKQTFVKLGKAGGCPACMLEGISRLIAKCLTLGADPQSVAKKLAGLKCPSGMWDNGILVHSCLDAIARVLKEESEKEE